MGVTIHFEGKLKNREAYTGCLELATRFCRDHHWRSAPIESQLATLRRVHEEEDREYVSRVEGIEIQPHEDSEPFRLEFAEDLSIQEYTKTQFAPIEVHVKLVELLRLLSPLFEELKVEDEGGYFETGDLALLAANRDDCTEAMQEYLSQPENYSGPLRLENGRIVDLCIIE